MKRAATRPRRIQQRELEAYQLLKAEAKRAEEALGRARAGLVERIRAGVGIAPGELNAYLVPRESRRFTKAEVERILGLKAVAKVEAAIEPIIEWHFHVVGAEASEFEAPSKAKRA
jgi:hypothetical protein